jgi:hypothetical protein
MDVAALSEIATIGADAARAKLASVGPDGADFGGLPDGGASVRHELHATAATDTARQIAARENRSHSRNLLVTPMIPPRVTRAVRALVM